MRNCGLLLTAVSGILLSETVAKASAGQILKPVAVKCPW